MDVLRVSDRCSIPISEVDVRVSRSGGPGGQHANVTESRVEVRFDVAASPSLTEAQRHQLRSRLGDVIVAVSADTRSQARNRQLAMERLRDRLARALQPTRKRRGTKPTAGSKRRRRQAKRRRSETKRLRRPPRAD